jgi:hypothetical protein
MMPELFRIGGLTLYTYGFMWVVGIWLAVWWGLRRASRYGVSPDDALDITFWSVVVGIVGGRAAFVLTNWSQYAPDPLSIFRVWEGGMSYFGGFGLAIATAIYIIRARRIPIWQVGDLAAPSLALGYGIARIGCFAAGCCYGAPTDLPWGVVFPGHDARGASDATLRDGDEPAHLRGTVVVGAAQAVSGTTVRAVSRPARAVPLPQRVFPRGSDLRAYVRRVHLRASGRRVGDSDRHRASLGTGATARAHARQKCLECCMILQSTRTVPHMRRTRDSPRSLSPPCRTCPTGAGGKCGLRAHYASQRGYAAWRTR